MRRKIKTNPNYTDFEKGGFSLEGYKASLYPNTDYAALAHSFRVAGGKLAIAAMRVSSSWDGHHRLAFALIEWLKAVAGERNMRQAQ
jgi:hypothetical protein